ncbi:EamA family transporter [Patescibacteria group bacterium]
MSRTLISIIGGLSGMLGWGTSDFFANQASDSVGHTKTFFWSQIAGLTLMSLLVFFLSSELSSFSPLIIFLIIVTGIAYALGYLFFYKGFEIGNVSVVSAVINLQNLFIIGISYFVFKQSLTTFQIPAIILLIIGILLVSVDFKNITRGTVSLVKGVKETIGAAAMFGIFFWPINEYVVERVDWVAASFAVKLVAVIFVYLVSKITKKNLKLTKSSIKMKKTLIIVGILEALAVIGVSYGVSFGDAIIVGPISSALTVVTVTLAMIFLKEKITKFQGIGILLTIIGIVVTAF